MAITDGQQGDSTMEIGANSLEIADDFIALAYVSTLNAHLRFSTSTNVSGKCIVVNVILSNLISACWPNVSFKRFCIECTSLTRLTAALLDTVGSCLDYSSTRLE